MKKDGKQEKKLERKKIGKKKKLKRKKLERKFDPPLRPIVNQ